MEKEILNKAKKRQNKWQQLSRRWGYIYYISFVLGLIFSGAAIALTIFESSRLDIIASTLSFIMYGIIIEMDPSSRRNRYNEAQRIVSDGVLKYGNDDIEDQDIINILEESERVANQR